MIIAVFALLVIIVPFASAYHVWHMASVHSTVRTDTIIVLGAAQYDGVPSPVFANRLDHAKSLYDQGVAEHIITVGGKQPGDQFTEGEAGRAYLEAAGVPGEDLEAMMTGSDTLQSLEAVAGFMNERGWRSSTIVSDPAHMARSAAIATTLGMAAQTNPTPSGPGSQITAEYIARETVGYLYYVGVQQWSVPRVIAPLEG